MKISSAPQRPFEKNEETVMTDIPKRKFKIGACVAAGLVVIFIAWLSGSPYGRMGLYFLNIKPLLLKGLAVDSVGVPLSGVKIQIAWSTAGFLIGKPRDNSRFSWVTSDKNGEWAFDLPKPDMAGINDAKMEGYAFERGKSTLKDLGAISAQAQGGDVKAVVYMRRKKEEMVLLRSPYLGGSAEFLRTEKGHPVRNYMDILKGTEYTIEKETFYEDIQVDAHLDTSNKCWIISFHTQKDEDGILLRNEALYEAPLDGYKRAFILTIPIQEANNYKEAYLYLRSRMPAVYSRIFVEIEVMDREEKLGGQQLTMRKYSITNPYGERSLELGERFKEYTFAWDEMVHEAKKAIQSGTLPKKPENLEAYLEEREKAIRKAKNIPMR
jgi:hypothetical protein